MCKIIPIHQYLRNAELRDDYYDEVRFYTSKYIKDCQILYKLKNCISFPFRILLIQYFTQLIEDDKNCILYFKKLYCLYNMSLIQSI